MTNLNNCAYIVMRRHPKVLKEFEAVKGGANLPAEEPTATNPKPTSLIINGNL